METIVALLLTSILIGFAYSSLRLVRQQARMLTAGTGAVNEALLFNRALQADTKNSQAVHIHEDGFTFTASDMRIRYQAMDSVWLRLTQTAPADTFRIRTDSLRAWLNGSLQLQEEGLTDEVVIYARGTKPGESFQLTKRYDAAQLIQLTDTTDGWDRH